MNNLSQFITLLLSFTTKLQRKYRRPLYVILIALAIVAIVVTFDPSAINFLHLSAKTRGLIDGIAMLVAGAVARGNSGDPLITAEQDIFDSLIRSEKNGARGVEVVTDAAESAAPDAAAAIEEVVPGAAPVVDALAELLPSAGAGSSTPAPETPPAPAEPVAQAPVPPVA